MVNIENLPRLIEIKGTKKWYNLEMHITAWNKICVCYRLVDRWTPENNDFYLIFSCVVEPDMDNEINYSDDHCGIVDVPSFEMAVNVISARINAAIDSGLVSVRY